jgi:hypothetical protein
MTKPLQSEKFLELFKDFDFIDGAPVLMGKMPDSIFDEFKQFVENGRKIKDHPLGFLREHINAGYNSYQISVSDTELDQSFAMPYLIALGQMYMYKKYNMSFDETHRRIRMFNNINHYDGLDIWVNYAYKGDVNHGHTHAGQFSGVIYIKNVSDNPTVFTHRGEDVEHYGQEGYIGLFPANLWHRVDEISQDYERITMSFNLTFNG